MPITITSDRIVLTNDSGVTKFDTDEGLFVCTDFFSGSQAIDKNEAIATSFGRTNVDRTTIYTLETGASADATHILGLYRCNWTVTSAFGGTEFVGLHTQQVGGTLWRSANATGVDMICKHRSSHQSVSGSQQVADPVYWQGFSLYTFFLDGTNVKCKERVMLQSYIPASGSTQYKMTKNAGTLDYRLYCGLFV